MRRALALAVCSIAAGCADKAPAAAITAPGGAGEVVARIDGEVITAGQLQQRLDALDAYSRARFTAPEQKRKFLENLVRFEVLAREAQDRGYDRDPEVQRALKSEMVRAFLQKEINAKLKPEDATDAEVERYYRANLADFRQPEQVRVSQIFTRDRARAEQAVTEARALRGKPGGDKALRELVARLSEDEDSKSRGGDLTFFDRKTAMYPRPVVEAAFALEEIGDVSPPVASEHGFAVLVLTQRRPGFTRALPEVSREIRRQLLRERGTKKTDELVAEMRKRLKVEIYEDKLARVVPAAAAPLPPPGEPR
jgi:peptidyl-prolyl cis-trans isomerase C